MKLKHILFAIITIAVLVVVYWFVSPLWRKVYVNEALPVARVSGPAAAIPNGILKTGTFTGFDRLHSGSGTASLIQVDGKYVIRFESDFSVTNGPDLYVGFGNNGIYAKGSEIAKLKGTNGAQNYELPADFDPNKYGEVWVWCKAFAVPFAKSELK